MKQNILTDTAWEYLKNDFDHYIYYSPSVPSTLNSRKLLELLLQVSVMTDHPIWIETLFYYDKLIPEKFGLHNCDQYVLKNKIVTTMLYEDLCARFKDWQIWEGTEGTELNVNKIIMLKSLSINMLASHFISRCSLYPTTHANFLISLVTEKEGEFLSKCLGTNFSNKKSFTSGEIAIFRKYVKDGTNGRNDDDVWKTHGAYLNNYLTLDKIEKERTIDVHTCNVRT